MLRKSQEISETNDGVFATINMYNENYSIQNIRHRNRQMIDGKKEF